MNGNGGPVAETAAKSAAAKLTDSIQSTTRRRSSAGATHVVASAVWVTAANGNRRALLPWRCPGCGWTHLSQARGDLPPTLQRRGPHGAIVLHLAAVEAAA